LSYYNLCAGKRGPVFTIGLF